MRIVVIGGSDAGISAALRARELRPTAAVAVALADAYPNFSICGLPFLFSNEVTEWSTLAHRTLPELEATGVAFSMNTRARSIDTREQSVELVGPAGSRSLSYDKLILCVGARPLRPRILGVELEGVHVMREMEDAFFLQRRLKETQARSVILVGAGYIGVEMADALTHAGIQVTIVERSVAPMASLDPELGALVAEELRRHGVVAVSGTNIHSIERDGTSLIVRGDPDFEARAEIVLVSSGVLPNTELATSAGAELGPTGAIQVNERMETSLPGIYAAGDCVETWHRLLERYSYLPLGSTAHKQGRTAGENAVGGQAAFAGSLGTQVVKIFEKVVGRTGLREDEARREGFEPHTVQLQTPDHKKYYPGSSLLHLRVTGDLRSGRLLGAQIVGATGAEVSKRLDIFATALHHRMLVKEIVDLDLSYTPPLSAPWDPVQAAAQAWEASRGSELGRSVSPKS